jgi:hypothetical protein
LKLDVAGFFASIDKETLYRIIAGQIRNPELLYTERAVRRGLIVAHVREIGWATSRGWRLRLPACVVVPSGAVGRDVSACGMDSRLKIAGMTINNGRFMDTSSRRPRRSGLSG